MEDGAQAAVDTALRVLVRSTRLLDATCGSVLEQDAAHQYSSWSCIFWMIFIPKSWLVIPPACKWVQLTTAAQTCWPTVRGPGGKSPRCYNKVADHGFEPGSVPKTAAHLSPAAGQLLLNIIDLKAWIISLMFCSMTHKGEEIKCYN